MMSTSIATAAVAETPGNGLEIRHLGTNNTMVRVNPDDGRFLILPIQESNDDATVNLIVDGKLEQVMNIRLAKSKIDYTVPLFIGKYSGHDLLLNIVTAQGRSSVREVKEDACWQAMEIADTFETTNREKFRPLYHHTPLYGWMNDPNGMFYADGVWHLSYQWNPYGSKWQNMNWGLSTSRDLVHWDNKLEPLLEPDALGMIFSGSCVVDSANTAGFGKDAVLAMYTSAGTSQMQSLAWSRNGGYDFTVYPANPTLTLETEARDPNMFWHAPIGQWVMVLAHPLEHEMLIFNSPDMKTWTLKSHFGKGLGAQDGVWECPDLLQLTLPDTGEKKWVLICNLNPGGPFGGSATQYFIGDFDGSTFTPDVDTAGNVPTKWLDFGKDNYASVSFSNAPGGRQTIIGWMSNWEYAAEVPTTQFRSANTLPRDLTLFRSDSDGQLYVASKPSAEVESLRGKLVKTVSSGGIDGRERRFNLPQANDGVCEIELGIDPKKASNVRLTLSNPLGEKVVMVYDVAKQEVSMDRRESGIVDFSSNFPAVTAAPTLSDDATLNLRLFIDRSSIELFERDGRFAMTNLVFPTSPYTTLSISSDGPAKISDLKIYSINPTL